MIRTFRSLRAVSRLTAGLSVIFVLTLAVVGVVLMRFDATDVERFEIIKGFFEQLLALQMTALLTLGLIRWQLSIEEARNEVAERRTVCQLLANVRLEIQDLVERAELIQAHKHEQAGDIILHSMPDAAWDSSRARIMEAAGEELGAEIARFYNRVDRTHVAIKERVRYLMRDGNNPEKVIQLLAEPISRLIETGPLLIEQIDQKLEEIRAIS